MQVFKRIINHKISKKYFTCIKTSLSNKYILCELKLFCANCINT